MKLCDLCGLKPPIKNSHVVSKFVVRWLKDGTPHGKLRHSDDLAKPYQDGWKSDYLCVDCEERFSRWEGWFSREIFNPFLDGKRHVFPILREALLFSASIHFRALLRRFEIHPSERLKPAAKAMFDVLATVCLSETLPSTAFYAYMEFVPIITPAHSDWPPGVNTYVRESIDTEFFPWITPRGAIWISYVKLPSIILFFSVSDLSLICPIPGFFDAIRVPEKGTMTPAAQGMVLLKMMRDTVVKRSFEIQDNYRKIPMKQRTKMQQQILSHPDKKSFRAHETYLADQILLEEWTKKRTH